MYQHKKKKSVIKRKISGMKQTNEDTKCHKVYFIRPRFCRGRVDTTQTPHQRKRQTQQQGRVVNPLLTVHDT